MVGELGGSVGVRVGGVQLEGRVDWVEIDSIRGEWGWCWSRIEGGVVGMAVPASHGIWVGVRVKT